MKMKETVRSRTSLFKRVPMARDLFLGELIYLLIGEILIIIFAMSFAKENMLSIALGFLEGVVLAMFIMIHMALSLEDSITMFEEEALRHTRKTYIFRTVVLSAVILLIIFLDLGNVVAALFGLMSLKVAAYIQPISQKYKSKGR